MTRTHAPERLTWVEICERYSDEWVLVADIEKNDDRMIMSARVLDRDESMIHSRRMASRSPRSATLAMRGDGGLMVTTAIRAPALPAHDAGA